MLTRRARRSVVPAVGLAVLVAACDVRVGDDGLSLGIADGRASDDWHRTYDLADGGVVEIANINGTIQASPADDGRVDVIVRRRASARSDEAARALLDTVTMREDVSPERVSLGVEREEGRPFAGRGVFVEYELRLPPGVRASLTTENGDVRVEGLSGAITASTTNGRVVGRALSGGLEARTVNGGIDVAFDGLASDTHLATVNGGIRVLVGPGVRATLDASAVNGGVSVDEALSFDAGTRDRTHLTGRLNDGGPALRLETINGAVRVTGRE
jgi:hypothetical protein